MNRPITKAVIPAAGLGTRFLPWTKAVPKELLPMPIEPVLQKIIRYHVEAGVKEIALVLGEGKEAIKNHFSPNPALEADLVQNNKLEELAKTRETENLAKITYLYQQGPKGNATPILNAKEFVGNEPFLVAWADDFIRSKHNMASRLIAAYRQYPGQIITGLRMPKPEDKLRYAYAAGKEVAPGIIQVEKIIEKPGEDAPSDIGIVSDYLYTPLIFDAIEAVKAPPGEELVYTLALEYLIQKGEPVYCVFEEGSYADCGNPLDYFKNLIIEATGDSQYGEALKKWLEKEYNK